MRVVHLNCVYGNGSTGKIVKAMHEYLKNHGDESYVLYGYGPKSADASTFRVVPPLVRKAQSLRSRLTGYPYGGAAWGTNVTVRLLDTLRPDVVHIHCYNAYIANIYKVLNYLKYHQISTVITNHAEFMYTGGCTHSFDCNKWLTGCGGCRRIGKEHPVSLFFDRTREEWELLRDSYAGFDLLTICCVSDWLRKRAERSPFFEGRRVLTVLNGLDTDTFKYRLNSGLRAGLNGRGDKIVLHVTPDFGSSIKGGKHVLEMAKRMRHVQFVIVGNDGGVTTNLPNVQFVGRVNDQVRLAEYYSVADVCLLTSEKETFSMVTAESLCCGTPVVGFKAGGPETIALPMYSDFVEQGDDDSLERSLREMLEGGYSKTVLSSEAADAYSHEYMCKNYYDIYLSVAAGVGGNGLSHG